MKPAKRSTVDNELCTFCDEILLVDLTKGPRTPQRLTCEAIDEALVLEWLADAQTRGLVEPTTDGRWALTAAGHGWYQQHATEHRSISVSLPEWRNSQAPLPRASHAVRRWLSRRDRT